MLRRIAITVCALVLAACSSASTEPDGDTYTFMDSMSDRCWLAVDEFDYSTRRVLTYASDYDNAEPFSSVQLNAVVRGTKSFAAIIGIGEYIRGDYGSKPCNITDEFMAEIADMSNNYEYVALMQQGCQKLAEIIDDSVSIPEACVSDINTLKIQRACFEFGHPSVHESMQAEFRSGGFCEAHAEG